MRVQNWMCWHLWRVAEWPRMAQWECIHHAYCVVWFTTPNYLDIFYKYLSRKNEIQIAKLFNPAFPNYKTLDRYEKENLMINANLQWNGGI